MKSLILFLFIALSVSSAQTFKISGKIKDASSGEALPMANISLNEINKGATTDFDGRYEIILSPGKYNLIVSYIGYKTEKLDVDLKDKDLELNINLISTQVLLQEVSVYSTRDEESSTVSSLSMQSKQMEEISSVFPDLFRSIQSLPGLAVNNEFSAKFNVRGGNFDENLVLVNGTQVYEPFHVKEADNASIGIFNLDLMKKANLVTGGFSARYGDRLSSVLNIEYREGNRNEHTGSATLSLTNLDGYVEGPISSKASYILGIRKSYMEYVLTQIDADESIKPSFYDIQGVLTYHFNDLDKLQFKFIHAGDDFTNGPVDEHEGPTTSSLIINNQPATATQASRNYNAEDSEYFSNLFDLQSTFFLSSNAFINTSVSFYQQIDREKETEDESFTFEAANNNRYFHYETWKWNYDYDLNIKTWEAKTSLDVKVNPFFDINAGISYLNINYDESNADLGVYNITNNINSFPDTMSLVKVYGQPLRTVDANSYKLAGYLENVFQLNQDLILNAGIRGDYFAINKELTINPRISLSYSAGDDFTLRAAWGKYSQSPIYRQLAYSVPSDTNTKSTKADHYILGAEKNFYMGIAGENKLSLKLEGYYKKYFDLISSERTNSGGIVYSRKNDSEGYAAGVDFYISLNVARFYYGWISYGLLFAREDLLTDSKGDFPRYTDQRHTLSLVNDFDLGADWGFNLRFTYGSGFAYTPWYSIYNAAEKRYELVPGDKNSERVPEYKRVDVRVSKSFQLFGLAAKAFLDVNNLFNFKNIYSYSYRIDNNGNATKSEIELWPILPSIGLTVNF